MRNIYEAPELELLKGDVNATPEGKMMAEKEYKRTKLSLDLLDWVVNNDYEKFTACQKEGEKLSKGSFEKLRNFTLFGFYTDESLYALQVYLVINDLGKIKSFVEKIKNDYGITSVDHDEILYEGLKRNPTLSESFNSLSEEYQSMILEGLKAKFNMGQFIQCENLPVSLVPLKQLSKNVVRFYMMHVLYDIGGAAGHVRADGSLTITESYWQNFQNAYHSIQTMIILPNIVDTFGREFKEYPDVDAIIAYELYLTKSALKLGISDKLDCLTISGRGKIANVESAREELYKSYALIKLCNLLRVSNGVDAKIVEEAFESQPEQVKNMLYKELKRDGITESGILPYYLPAVLANAVNYFKEVGAENPIKSAFDAVLPIIANIYGLVRTKMVKDENDAMCVTAFLGELAQKALNPQELKNYIFELEKVNCDYIVKCVEREKIEVEKADAISISGNNVLVVGMGGGSDCIQACMLGKFLLPNCKNVISIRTQRTESQDIHGKMNLVRLIYSVERSLSDDVYLCNQKTFGEGRFFENLPARVDMNLYLIIDRGDGALTAKIQEVLDDIAANGEPIDTIVGVDTGGDCLYPIGVDSTLATPNLDRTSLIALKELDDIGYDTYISVVCPGIDSPNGITSKILENAEAKAYYPSEEEKKNILETYKRWKMDGSDPSKVGLTPLIWQSALEGKRGLITLNIPSSWVLSDENPWIPSNVVTDVSEAVIFMATTQAINSINLF